VSLAERAVVVLNITESCSLPHSIKGFKSAVRFKRLINRRPVGLYFATFLTILANRFAVIERYFPYTSFKIFNILNILNIKILAPAAVVVKPRTFGLADG